MPQKKYPMVKTMGYKQAGAMPQKGILENGCNVQSER
jgi:hypothetical protein